MRMRIYEDEKLYPERSRALYVRAAVVFTILPAAIFLPAWIYIIAPAIVVFGSPLSQLERLLCFASLGIANSFNLATADFNSGEINDFLNYYDVYLQVAADEKFSIQKSYFPEIFGLNIEIVLPLFFYTLDVLLWPLSKVEFAFFVSLFIFYLYYIAICRTISVGRKRDKLKDYILLISMMGLSSVIFLQLPRQGLAGAFVLLALAERRVLFFLIFSVVAIMTHFSSVFVVFIYIILRKKYSLLWLAAGLLALAFLANNINFFFSTSNIPKLDYYNSQFYSEVENTSFLSSIVTIGLVMIIYLLFKFSRKKKADVPQVTSRVGGGAVLIFHAALLVAFYNIPLFFDRAALLFITAIIWIHVGYFSVSLRGLMLPSAIIFVLAIWKTSQIIGGGLYYHDFDWYLMPIRLI
jgi:hypothetical protein